MVWGVPSTAPAPLTQPCSFFSGKACEVCLKNVTCLWCITNKTCHEYPVRSIFPSSSICAMSDARWGVCWLNFETLIITMAVVAGLIILAITVCCCYCCYCRKSSRSRLRLEAEEENLIRERERRKQEALQRKNERTVKHNEIRKKYGTKIIRTAEFYAKARPDLSPDSHRQRGASTEAHLNGLLQEDMDHPYSKFEND